MITCFYFLLADGDAAIVCSSISSFLYSDYLGTVFLIFFILIFGHLLLLCHFFHYFKFRSLWNQNLTKKYIFYSISQCFYSNPPLSSLPLPSFFSSFPYPSSSSPIILYSFIFFPFMSLLLLFFLSLKILQPFFLYISQMQVYVQILPSSRSPSSYNPEAFQNR